MPQNSVYEKRRANKTEDCTIATNLLQQHNQKLISVRRILSSTLMSLKCLKKRTSLQRRQGFEMSITHFYLKQSLF